MPESKAGGPAGRVLVAGASGMIGSALCNSLLDRGEDVVGLSRSPDRAARRQSRVEWHGWEPAEERPPAAAFDGVDRVVNLTGEPINQRWNSDVKDRIVRSRIRATGNLVETIGTLKDRPEVLVNASAIGYYGDRGDELLYESADPGDDFLAGVVVRWEEAATAASELGVRTVTIRSGTVLDRHGGLLGELLTPFRLGLGGPIAGGDQYISWIHRHDEVGILLFALDNDRLEGPVNATAPNPVTNRAFSQELGRAVNRPALIPVPGFAVDLIKGAGVGQAAREGQRVYPRRVTDAGYVFKQPELAGALAHLLRR
ncbi:MAG: TIGR01777 family oxidoreductase [Solirubrobacterales bacterium]|nr:TIGR01777 family oxidoreductase [Solirubrobacterales bacterium]